MAGLGRKVWSAGEVVTAANVQGYLQDQTTQVFASSAARSSALGTAVSEGMTSYLSDVNEVQVYDGSAWTAPGVPQIAGKNKIINGAFDIWQRSTSTTNPTDQTVNSADRWKWIGNGSGATRIESRQTFTPGAAPVAGYEGQYFYRLEQTVAGSGMTVHLLDNRIEDVRTLAGQTATLSFWAKADSARTLSATIQQDCGSGGSGQFAATPQNYTLSTSWQRFTMTFSIPSLSGKTIGTSSWVAVRLSLPQNTTFTFDLWGVQLEAGSVATPFSRAAGTLQGELAACERYAKRITALSSYMTFGNGWSDSSTLSYAYISLPVTMRTSPTVTSSAASTFRYVASGVASAGSSVVFSAQPNLVRIDLTTTGLTAGRGGELQSNNSTSSYVMLDSEL